MDNKTLKANHNAALKQAQVAQGELQKVQREKKVLETEKEKRDIQWAEGQRDLGYVKGKLDGMAELMQAFGRGIGSK